MNKIQEYLNNILHNTLHEVEKGQHEIYSIAEHTKNECKRLEQQLIELKAQVKEVIAKVDELQKMEKAARIRLMIVSRDFKKFSEDDIKAAYENTKGIQIALSIEREKEKYLRKKRDELEQSYINMIKILNQAENLTLRFGVAISYLKNNLEHMEEHLQDLKNKQNFAAQIIKVQEEERKRVARDIHDGPCQTMANVIIHAEICEKLFDKDREQAKGELDELKHIVRGCLNELRKIIFDLRPPALDDLGLEAVVDRYCNDFQENTGIEVVFKKYGDKLRFNSNIEIAIFRIIQEALINIKKHSDAKHATVKLEIKNNLVNLLIADDGKGFNWDLSHDYSEKDRHFGLINIKERVELLNGSVKIETSPGYGTKIFISIPLQGKEAEDE